MKKFISLMLSLVMLSGLTVSYAEGTTTPLKSALASHFGTLGINIENITGIPVDTDISVNINGGNWRDRPTTVNIDSLAATDVGLKADIDMDTVKSIFQICVDAGNAVAPVGSDLKEEWDSCYVTGEFKIEIDYPNQARGFVINQYSMSDSNMTGFTSTEAGKDLNAIFKEVSPRTLTAKDAKTDTMTITVKVREDVKVGVSTLTDNLSDLELVYTGNRITRAGAFTVRGRVTGYTDIMSKVGTETPVRIGHIEYNFSQRDGEQNDTDYRDPADDISATILVPEITYEGGGSLGAGGVEHKTLVIYDGEDEISRKKYVVNTNIEIGSLEMPEKDGYVFAGYYYDDEFTKPVEESFKLAEDTVIYIKWTHSVLDQENHIAYIIGYPMEDGREEVRPENNMSREEIATVFYRLLKKDVRDELFASINSFPDVESTRWSNKAISTMANGEYVNGYEDDTFKPANPITRAEFVTIATRFFAVDDVYTGDVDFTDVYGHWAERYIKYATAAGWIDGYEDNTFRPDRYITRAEVMKIINHMLNRAVTEEGLIEDAKRWVDNSQDKWYYYEVIEATNFHAYNKVQGEEAWTQILENEILNEKSEYEDADADDSDYDQPLL